MSELNVPEVYMRSDSTPFVVGGTVLSSDVIIYVSHTLQMGTGPDMGMPISDPVPIWYPVRTI